MKEAKGVGGGVMKKSPGSQGSCQKDLQDYDPSRNALFILTKWKTLPRLESLNPIKCPKKLVTRAHQVLQAGSHFSLYQNPPSSARNWSPRLQCHRGETLSPILEPFLEEQGEFSFTVSAPHPLCLFHLEVYIKNIFLVLLPQGLHIDWWMTDTLNLSKSCPPIKIILGLVIALTVYVLLYLKTLKWKSI